ncbi:MAG TPA: histidine kinase [Thermomicrobiales bacterium]|nr:histidine kinase [Thermomicrobiales bacterium]
MRTIWPVAGGRLAPLAQRAGAALPDALDLALALALAGLFVAEGGYAREPLPGPVVLLLTLPLAWRRRWPLAVLALVALGTLVALGAPSVAVAALLIAAYTVGAHSRRRALALVAVLAVATAFVPTLSRELPRLPGSALPYLLFGTLWLVGYVLQARQRRADAFAAKAARLERGQEEAARAAVAAERARIARELHDVVAHNVSVMVVQAGAARQVAGTSPEQAREALLAVEASGREALAELRHLLGLLRADGEEAALDPQPGVEHLDTLVRRVADAGLPVALRVVGAPRPLPPGLSLAAYRIVQEALTNALKHAGPARTEVVLAYRETEVQIAVLDEGGGDSACIKRTCPKRRLGSLDGRSGESTGRGLVGMRERVALYGGALEAGPRPGGGFAVQARLPLAPAWP